MVRQGHDLGRTNGLSLLRFVPVSDTLQRGLIGRLLLVRKCSLTQGSLIARINVMATACKYHVLLCVEIVSCHCYVLRDVHTVMWTLGGGDDDVNLRTCVSKWARTQSVSYVFVFLISAVVYRF
jgi:hypothetical protein